MFLLCLFQLFGSRKMEDNVPKCWVGVKVFGNELSVFTCEDLYSQINQLSLSAAGLAVKLLKVSQWLPCRLLSQLLSDFLLSVCSPSSLFLTHSCFSSHPPLPPLFLPGSWGSVEPQGCADDRGASFAVSVWFAHQIGHQHDNPPFTASEGQRQLQGHISLLPRWIHQTQVHPYNAA